MATEDTEEPKRPIQAKAKGKKLTTRSKKILQNIPPEFIAEAGLRQTKQAVPTETVPDSPMVENQIGSSVEMDNTTQCQKIDDFLDTPMPVTLTDSVITPQGQLGTRTRVLDEGIQTITPSPTQVEANVENKGADRSVKTTIVVPEVFPNELFAKEKPDLIPPEFRGVVPLETTRIDEAGTAVEPTLGPTDVSKSQEQTKEGIRRLTDQTRDPTVLPVTLEGEIILPNLQKATVERTLDDEPQTIAQTVNTQEGSKVEGLGDDLTLKTQIEAPNVFPENRFAAEKSDNIPEKFKVAIPRETVGIVAAGTAVAPTLSVGELSESQEQIKVGIKRTTIETRSPASMPQVLTGEVVLPNLQNATVTETVDDAPLSITPTPTTQDGSRVENLGGGIYHKTQIEAPSVFPREQFGAEKSDTVPEKFKAAIPRETTRVDAAGTAIAPTLVTGQLSETQEQIKVGVKQTTQVFRDPTSFPQTLTGEVILPNLQKATATETIDDAPLTLTPTVNTQDGSKTENLGDGVYQRILVEAPSVFANEEFTQEKTDNIPEKFKVALPRETTRSTAAGTAVMPTLTASEIAETQEQTKVGIKRTTVTTRDPATLPQTLAGEVILSNLQKATVTETIDDAVLSITPTPTTQDGSRVENLGGGIYHRTQVEAPSVFPANQFAAEKPEVLPVKFRAAIPAETTRVDEAGTAAAPTLSATEIAESQEQTKVGVRRVSVTTRNPASFPQSLVGKRILDNQLQATVTETVDDGPPMTLTPGALLQPGSNIEQLGGGLEVKTEVVAPKVFEKRSFSKQISDNIPAAFKAQVPVTETQEDTAGTASLPTLGTDEIQRTQQQITEYVMRTTVQTRPAPSFTPITFHSFDSDLQAIIQVTLSVENLASTYSPPTGVIDFDEREINGEKKLRTVYRLIADTLPSSYDTREPGVRRFPALLSSVTVAKVDLADDAAGDPRSEVKVFPVWRPGFSIEVNYIITTSFHFTAPAPDSIYAMVTQDITYNGVSFQVNLQGVLNDALSAGVTFTDDGYYGNLVENFSFSASTPSAASYSSAIGSTQVIASKVQPWRRLWVKRTTKLILL